MESSVEDAIHSIGFLNNCQELNTEENPTILFPYLTEESIPVAQAVHDVVSSTGKNIAIVIKGDGLFYHITSEGPRLIKIKGKPILTFGQEQGNIGGFRYYSENKKLTGMILRKYGIPTPREISINQSKNYELLQALENNRPFDEVRTLFESTRNKTYHRICQFLETTGTNKFVIKPFDGAQGDDVYIIQTDIFKASGVDYLDPKKHDIARLMLIQEKIEPYPLRNHSIVDKGDFLDWNVRVLVTYDPIHGKYVPVGIITRIDDRDMPVNISISAYYQSFKGVIDDCGLHNEFIPIKERIEETAIQATRALVEYSRKKVSSTFGENDFQILTGVDIILDENKKPFVIEVNDMRSGCNYELMKLEGIASLYPLARSIVRKFELYKALKECRQSAVDLLDYTKK